MIICRALSVTLILDSFDILLILESIYIGVDFKVKVMDAAGPDGRTKRVKVTIWDTGKKLFFFSQLYPS